MGINKTLEAHIKLKTLEQIPLSTIDAIKFKENLDKDLRYLIEHKNSKKEVEECFKNAKNKYFNDLLYHWLNYIVSILEIKEYSNTYSHKYLFNKNKFISIKDSDHAYITHRQQKLLYV